MSGERDGASEHLAGLIVGALHGVDVVAASDIARATSIAAEEIDVNKATGDYWCSWCNLQPESSGTRVNVSDDNISFATDGFTVDLIRLQHVTQDGRIAVEVKARAHSFGGRCTTEIRADDLLRFVVDLRDSQDAGGRDHTATLRSVPGDIIIEFRMHLGSATGRYLFQSGSGNSNTATLSGSFHADAAILAKLERHLRALLHDSWGRS